MPRVRLLFVLIAAGKVLINNERNALQVVSHLQENSESVFWFYKIFHETRDSLSRAKTAKRSCYEVTHSRSVK